MTQGAEAYRAARAGMPLLTHRLPIMGTYIVLFAISAVLYASAPCVIRSLPIGWLVILKTITGASFAAQTTLLNLLSLEMYGAANLGIVFPLVLAASGVAFLVG